MWFRNGPSQEEVEALERAADMARKDGDTEHEKALRQAAKFKRRQLREIEAGWTGTPVATFIDNI
jgi:hypothetical protein